MQSIAVNPNNSSQIIAGTVNGGVWRTTNANTANPTAITWTQLTDQLGSLAIGAVAYDAADATGNTFYAGTGLFGNAFDSGGPAIGLYRTTDGGTTWALLGQGSGSLANSGPVTAASNGAPIIITAANHGLRTGAIVSITGVEGNTAANGIFVVTVLNANQFRLDGSTGNGLYTGGGTWQTTHRIKSIVVSGQ